MFSDEQLEVLLKDAGSQRFAVLMLLASMGGPTSPSDISKKGISAGLRAIKKWNVPQILKNADSADYVTRVAAGWKLLPAGVQHLKDAGLPIKPKLVADTLHDLKRHVAAVKDAARRDFIQDAVDCFEQGLNRPAVVYSWIGVAWILRNHVLTHHLAAFNKAGKARFPKYKPISSIKQFAAMKETDLLQLCEDAGVLDKAEKKQLTQRLDLRNDCGHPNNLVVDQHTAASHLEILLGNVYEKY